MDKRLWSETIKKITPYTAGEQPQDMQYIKLNTNENPYPPSPNVAKAITGAVSSLRRYPDPEASLMRRAVTELYPGLSLENVFVGNGSDEILAFVFQAFFSNKEVVFPDITYSFYPVYAALYGASVKTIPLNARLEVIPEQYYGLNKGIILANPNAPTGLMLTVEAVEQIVRTNPDSLVVVDEAYVDFGAGTSTYLTQRYDNLLVIQTLSKSRSLAGMRIGFAVGNTALIAGLNTVKNSFNSYTIDSIANEAGAAAIRDKSYFEACVFKIVDVRDRAIKSLRAIGLEVLDSHTNFLFVRSKSIPGEELYLRLKKSGILVRHFKKPERIAQYIRITVGTEAEMQTLIKQLQSL